jgi:hypothetical protein
MNANDQVLSFGYFGLQSGNQIRFLEDIWLGANNLKEQYPNLYNISDIFSTRH